MDIIIGLAFGLLFLGAFFGTTEYLKRNFHKSPLGEIVKMRVGKCDFPRCDDIAIYHLQGQKLCADHAIQRTNPTGPPPRRIEP